jgi:hypothetical protein
MRLDVMYLIFLTLIEYIVSNAVSFSQPKHPSGHRTAVILTGQLRSGNISISSKDIRRYHNGPSWMPMDPHRHSWPIANDNRTPIMTELDNLIAPLALFGGVDLFVYLLVDRKVNSTSWNGDLNTYEPYFGDTRPCELYHRHPIFHNNTGNKVICMHEYEKQIYHKNPLWENNEGWRVFSEYPLAQERFLVQEYNKYVCNRMVKLYSNTYGVKYRYKVRLRFDLGVIEAIPSLDQFNFTLRADRLKDSRCMNYFVIHSTSYKPIVGGLADAPSDQLVPMIYYPDYSVS